MYLHVKRDITLIILLALPQRIANVSNGTAHLLVCSVTIVGCNNCDGTKGSDTTCNADNDTPRGCFGELTLSGNACVCASGTFIKNEMNHAGVTCPSKNNYLRFKIVILC